MKVVHYAAAGMAMVATARGQIAQVPALAPAPYTPPLAPMAAPVIAPAPASMTPAPKIAPAPSFTPTPSTSAPKIAPAPAPVAPPFVAPAPTPIFANTSAPAPAPVFLPPLPAPPSILAPVQPPAISPVFSDPCPPLPPFVQACIFTASTEDAVFTTVQHRGVNQTYAIRIADAAGQEREACSFTLADNQELLTDVCGITDTEATYRGAVRTYGGPGQ